MRRDRATSMGFALVALTSAALACKASPPKPELFGVFRGCTKIKADRTCLYTSGSTLTVWFDASASSKVEVQIDGDEVATKLIPAEDGARLELPLEDHAERVRVDMKGGRFELPLKWVQTATPAEAGPREAYRLHQAGLRALRRGDFAGARALLDRGEEAARTAGDLHRVREIAYLATYVDVTRLGDLSSADRRLQNLPEPTAFDGRALTLTSWSRGLVAWKVGDKRAAHRELNQATLWGGRLDDRARLDAMSLHGNLLVESGRSREAVALFDRLRANSVRSGCAKATDALNAAWARLALSQPEATTQAGEILEEALSGAESGCSDDVARSHQVINLALIRLELGDPEGAERWLARVSGRTEPNQRLWMDLLRARISLSKGKAEDATLRFEALASDAERLRLNGLSWRAHLGASRAYRANSNTDAAIQHLVAAEDLLDRQSYLLPAHEGRFAWLDEQDESARELVGLYLQNRQPIDAFAAARRARRRGLLTLVAAAELGRIRLESNSQWSAKVAAFEKARRALEEHRGTIDWSAPSSEDERMDAKERALASAVDERMDEALALLRPARVTGNAILDSSMTYVLPTLANDEPVFFVSFAGTTSVHDNRAGIVAGLRRSTIPRSSRVVLLSEVPRDAAVLGAALVEQTAVSYGLDLGSAHRSAPKSGRLIVSDPRGDLEAARNEAEALLQVWKPRGTVQLAGSAATRAAVTRELQRAEYFHYAGHGQSAGNEGWDSALLLADSDLTVGDILFLESVPRLVVLSGCETAKTGDGGGAGIGLAQAFLVAGSDAVIATHRTVASDDARAYAVALHQALAREGGDIYEAHRAAIETVGDAADAFVLLVR